MTKEARVINSEMPQRGVLRRIFQVTHDGAEEKRWPLSSTLSPLVPRGEREKLQSPSTRGLRLCRRPAAADPKGQRLGPSRAPELSYPLRLVFDTAAVRGLCEDAPGVLRAEISRVIWDFGFRHW